MKPGQVRALYIHSQAQGDQSIVYDDSRHLGTAGPRHDDAVITIYSGKAHLSPVPFGQTPVCTFLVLQERATSNYTGSHTHSFIFSFFM